MSKKAIKKSIKRSFNKSARYSAALVFGVLFLVSSMYGLPNFSATKASNVNASDSKNLKTTNTAKLDPSYKRYCDSDEHNGDCDYVAINQDSLLNIPFTDSFYQNYTDQIYGIQTDSNLSIRAPPINI